MNLINPVSIIRILSSILLIEAASSWLAYGIGHIRRTSTAISPFGTQYRHHGGDYASCKL
jgi:hypothetical protein